MGQEPSGVSAEKPSPDGIEREITDIRSTLDTELLELDRRRHQLVEPVKGPAGVALASGALLIVGGTAAIAVWAAQRNTRRSRLEALADRISRAFEEAPPEPARHSHVGLLTLAALAAGFLATRGLGAPRPSKPAAHS